MRALYDCVTCFAQLITRMGRTPDNIWGGWKKKEKRQKGKTVTLEQH